MIKDKGQTRSLETILLCAVRGSHSRSAFLSFDQLPRKVIRGMASRGVGSSDSHCGFQTIFRGDATRGINWHVCVCVCVCVRVCVTDSREWDALPSLENTCFETNLFQIVSPPSPKKGIC